MIMLDKDIQPSVSDIQNALSTNWPDLPPMEDINDEGNTLAFKLGDADVILGKMPAPIPWSELEGPCATSILWPQAADEVKQHNLHWIVTVSGEFVPLELSTLLTQATAAVLIACPSAIGVYWGNATLLIPKDMFIDFSKEVLPEGPPLHIWIDFRVGKDSEKSSSGFTTGLAALGHKEFEAQGVPEPPGELRERFLALTGYVIENGPVINDKDTIGESADEKIRVVYAKSSFGQEGNVMRLEYETPSAQSPWWKLW
jgi:hypothetical protein